MALISTLHATRSIERFDMFWRAYDWCVTRAGYPDIEYIIGADEDDVQMVEALQREIQSGARIKCPTKLVIGPKDQGNNGCWSNCYEHSTGKILIQLSDDFECPSNWASRIGEKINAHGGPDAPLVIGVGDPHFMDDSSAEDAPGGVPPYSGDGLLSLYIATRAYIEQAGFFLYPEYVSVYSDTELAQKAALDGCLVDGYEDIHFYHHWHGAPDDPRRDQTYYRHLTTECNDIGRQVFADRTWAACPDIYKERFPEDRDFLDPEEALCPIPLETVWKQLVTIRRARGNGLELKNKPFPVGSFRRAWIDGDWLACRNALVPHMNKYHQQFCGGRFLFHMAHHMWYTCTQQLGDKPLVGVREYHG